MLPDILEMLLDILNRISGTRFHVSIPVSEADSSSAAFSHQDLSGNLKATDVTSVAQTDFMSAGPTDTLEQRNNVSVGPADVTSVYKTDVTSVAATDLAAGGCNRYNPFGGVVLQCCLLLHMQRLV
ncbi:hypothetical protein PCANC_25457 [Puccinia coronata f. sp. avenae]|uniref:Uncharacterized protein n=1 Tax=Puccinia coronata f. sp. avenae TaxID=200324 RepID=A0A2N5TXT4_9BASI|nr:hypothetical protein PCANC_25457 [Puccinia coronata f. sp. avenae]